MPALFDENLHPRLHGKFRRKGLSELHSKLTAETKKLDAQHGESIQLRDGHTIKAKPAPTTSGVTGRHFEIRSPKGEKLGEARTPDEAATQALHRSAQSTHPESVGGSTRYKGLRDAQAQMEKADVSQAGKAAEKDHTPGGYRLHDRASGQSSNLTNFSSVNPRYQVLGPDGKVHDEFVSKKAAQGTVRDLNAAARAKKPVPKNDSDGKDAETKADAGVDHAKEARKHRAAARKAEKQGNTEAAAAFRRKAAAALAAKKNPSKDANQTSLNTGDKPNYYDKEMRQDAPKKPSVSSSEKGKQAAHEKKVAERQSSKKPPVGSKHDHVINGKVIRQVEVTGHTKDGVTVKGVNGRGGTTMRGSEYEMKPENLRPRSTSMDGRAAQRQEAGRQERVKHAATRDAADARSARMAKQAPANLHSLSDREVRDLFEKAKSEKWAQAEQDKIGRVLDQRRKDKSEANAKDLEVANAQTARAQAADNTSPSSGNPKMHKDANGVVIRTGHDIGIKHPDGGYSSTGNVSHVQPDGSVVYSPEHTSDMAFAHHTHVVVQRPSTHSEVKPKADALPVEKAKHQKGDQVWDREKIDEHARDTAAGENYDPPVGQVIDTRTNERGQIEYLVRWGDTKTENWEHDFSLMNDKDANSHIKKSTGVQVSGQKLTVGTVLGPFKVVDIRSDGKIVLLDTEHDPNKVYGNRNRSSGRVALLPASKKLAAIVKRYGGKS